MATTDITKKITRIFFAFTFVFMVSFFVLPTDDVYAGIDCAVDNVDDCDCNGTCETDTSSDANNCGACGVVCGGGSCVNGSCVPVTGGLVPCGRLYDNPDTIWNEQESCQICHTVPLANNIIDYLVGIVGLISVLFIIIAGIISATSMGSANALNLAKTAVSKSLFGFVFILVAWAIVNVGMVVFGFDDPMGDGSWSKIDCNIVTGPLIPTYCGDSLVDSPNDDGISEQCDPKETWYNFSARTGISDKGQWVEAVYRCNPTDCSLGCAGDPLVGDVGEGCYLDPIALPCKKGRYVCDSGTDTVVCEDTFTDLSYKIGNQACSSIGIYDYCCDSNSAELADGKIDNTDFLIVKASVGDLQYGPATGTLTYANLTTGLWGSSSPEGGWGAGVGFKCDDVCKNVGKVCIGVGLTNPAADACIYIQHDTGGTGTLGCNNDGRFVISMALPSNQASSNCDAWFAPFYRSNKGGSGQHYSTGYDKYEYHCVNNGLDSYWQIFNPSSIYAGYGGFTPAPAGSEGVCKPDPSDTCEFHGFDLAETACYCL